MEEEEEEEEGSSRGLCTLNTQTDVLLLTRASFNHGAFIFLPLTPQVSLSLFPGRWGGGEEMKPHKHWRLCHAGMGSVAMLLLNCCLGGGHGSRGWSGVTMASVSSCGEKRVGGQAQHQLQP